MTPVEVKAFSINDHITYALRMEVELKPDKNYDFFLKHDGTLVYKEWESDTVRGFQLNRRMVDKITTANGGAMTLPQFVSAGFEHDGMQLIGVLRVPSNPEVRDAGKFVWTVPGGKTRPGESTPFMVSTAVCPPQGDYSLGRKE